MTDCQITVDVIDNTAPIFVDIAPVISGVEVIEVGPINTPPIVIEAGEITGLPGSPGPPGPPGQGGVSPLTLTAHNAAETPLTLIGAASQTADLLDAGGISIDASGQLRWSGIDVLPREKVVGLNVRGNADTGDYYFGIGVSSKYGASIGMNATITGGDIIGYGGIGINPQGYMGAGPNFAILTGLDSATFGGGRRIVFLADDESDPTTDPVGGLFLFSSAGKLKARTPDGTITQLAPGGLVPPLVITGTDPATVPLTINNAPSQTANVLSINGQQGAFNIDHWGGINWNGPTLNMTMPAGQGGVFYGMLAFVANYPNGSRNNPVIKIHNWQVPGSTGLVLETYSPNTSADAFQIVESSGPTRAGFDVYGRLYLGPASSFGGGAGPMLFMGDDTSDPTTNPVAGTIVYSSAGKLKARTPDGTVTQIAPAAGGMTPPVVITNTNYLTVPFTIKGAPSQNVDFLDYKDSSDTVRLGINIDGAQIANLTAAGVRISGTDVNQATLDIRNPASAANDVMQIHPSTGGYHRFWNNGRIDFGAGGMPQSNGLPSYNFLAGASLGALKIQTNMGVANWIGFDNLETAIPTISHIGGGLTMGNQGWPSSDSDATNGPYAKCFAYGIGGTPPRTELFAAHRSGQFAIGTGTWMNPAPTNWGNGSGPMLYIEDATADANSAAYVYPRATLLYGMGGNQFKIRMWDGSSLVFGPSGALSIGVSGGGVPTVGGSYGGGAGPMLFMANDQSDPTTNPVGGGILYVSNGALKYRGTSGTVTTLAPA